MKVMPVLLATMLVAIVTTGCTSTAQAPSEIVSPGVVPGAIDDSECLPAECGDGEICVVVCAGDEPCNPDGECVPIECSDEPCEGGELACVIACGDGETCDVYVCDGDEPCDAGEMHCAMVCSDGEPCEPAGDCCPAEGGD